MQIDAKTVIDAQTAYRAMEIFLEAYWQRVGKPGELAMLLSDIHMSSDGQSSDPAQWFDWLNALGAAIRERR
ncbi:hypothetical protein [Stigmatella erecta]|uniref:Uncharacterized protein n=1 Tax=Stigmatella erecta TaxID=83460 RepID=A0A1I0GU82_9BACT|nr:hypothetical protein [Stigmatella erecta]SET74728.1 hypothetical protein SAMN05443639_104170 [Stigmatella erecta]